MNQDDLKVPGSYANAISFEQKILFALAGTGGGTAEEVVRQIEKLEPEASNKEVIAVTHRVLTELHTQGFIKGREQAGVIVYSLS